MSGFRIRNMVWADLEDVSSLATQLGYPNTLEGIRYRFARLVTAPGYGLFVAQHDTGKVIGYVQINAEPETLLAAPRADIAALIVDGAERGRGVGAALLKEAESWARKRDLPLIRVRSNITRQDAHRFYERNGYAIHKSSHIFTRTLVLS